MDFHELLARQVREHLAVSDTAGIAQFLDSVNRAYRDLDHRVEALQRTIEISQSEVVDRNKALAAGEKRYRDLIDLIPDIVAVHQDGVLIYLNSAGAKILGSDNAPSLYGRKILEFVHPDIRDSVAQRIQAIAAVPGSAPLARERFLRQDGSTIIVDVVAMSIQYEGRPAVLVVARDVTEQQNAEAEQAAHLETLALLEEAVIELDADLLVKSASESWRRLVRDVPGELTGKKIDSWVHADYRYFVLHDLNNLVTGRKARTVIRFPVDIPQGSSRWIEGKFIPVVEGSSVKGIRGVLRDVTLDHLAEKQINFYAYHDNLTGLPNRARMEETLYRALIRAERDHNRVAVGFVDLDNFNQINDYMGHRVGDRALLTISERLRSVLGGGDRLFRWGGDQFVVVLTDVEDLDTVRRVGAQLIECAGSPVDIEGEKIHVTFSVGFAVYPDDGITAEDLLGQADRAMVYAKSQGRYQVQYSRALPERGYYREQVSMRNQLITAITAGELKAFFQPIVKTGTEEIVGFEALARWPSYKGRVPAGPDVFIPIAENVGLISQLGDSMMRQSLSFLKMAKTMKPDLRLSVNISRRQLFASDFVERCMKLTSDGGINPSEVTLEVTESIAMLDVDFSFERLRALERAGFALSIDDFGTGYSSLSQLHEMPVHELKIDMAFVRRIHTAEGFRVVQAIANIGLALNLILVGEGVEDRATARQLEQLGIQYLQGNMFSKPMSADDAMGYLRTARS